LFGFDPRPTRGEDGKTNPSWGSKTVDVMEVFNCMWDLRLGCVLGASSMGEGVMLFA
jgi:hypothetical protein